MKFVAAFIAVLMVSACDSPSISEADALPQPTEQVDSAFSDAQSPSDGASESQDNAGDEAPPTEVVEAAQEPQENPEESPETAAEVGGTPTPTSTPAPTITRGYCSEDAANWPTDPSIIFSAIALGAGCDAEKCFVVCGLERDLASIRADNLVSIAGCMDSKNDECPGTFTRETTGGIAFEDRTSNTPISSCPAGTNWFTVFKRAKWKCEVPQS